MTLEQVAQIGQLALRLSLRQTEARHEDDLVGVHQLHGDVIGAGLLHRALGAGGFAAGRGATAEATGEHAHQRTVHGLGHRQRERDPGRADECAGDDQRDVVDRQTAHGDGGASAGVKHRDDDGHVSAADRDDEHQTVAQREHRGQHTPQQTLLGLHAQHDERDDGEHNEADVPHALRGEGELAQELDALQLAGGDQRAGERDGTDHDAESGGDQHDQRRQLLGGEDVVERDEGRRAAADRVEHGDELRHVGHLDLLRAPHADDRADEDADDQQHDGDEMLEAVADLGDEQHDERHNHRHDHAGRGDQVALARGLRRVHHVQADDEQHGGQQIHEPFNDAKRVAQHFSKGTHYLASSFLSADFFDLSDLNISSMRSVTT